MIPDYTIGTFNGKTDEQTDDLYYEALSFAFKNGIYKIDTAINYRRQRSENVVGRFIKAQKPSNLFLSTKGGFISDVDILSEEMKIIKSINEFKTIADGCHCIDPEFITYQMNKSIQNLGENNIDVYYIHNPETQLLINDHKTFYSKITMLFKLFEDAVNKGLIKSYGIASWYGFRADQNDRCYISLSRLHEIAFDICGKANNFKWILVPYNLQMTEIQTKKNQTLNKIKHNLITVAKETGISIVASCPFLQGNLSYEKGKFKFSKYESILKRCNIESPLGFSLISSLLLPNISSICIGMLDISHVRQNISILDELNKPQFSGHV